MPATRRLASPQQTALVMSLATAIGNHALSGQDPEIIGAVLAELMATFLLNHKIPADLKAQTALREDILNEHCKTVRELVAVQEDNIGSVQ